MDHGQPMQAADCENSTGASHGVVIDHDQPKQEAPLEDTTDASQEIDMEHHQPTQEASLENVTEESQGITMDHGQPMQAADCENSTGASHGVVIDHDQPKQEAPLEDTTDASQEIDMEHHQPTQEASLENVTEESQGVIIRDRNHPTEEAELDDASQGFGQFIVKVASLLTLDTVRNLGTVLNFSPADIDRCERDTNPGFVFVKSLTEKGIINHSDISRLLDSLKSIDLHGVADDARRIFERNCNQKISHVVHFAKAKSFCRQLLVISCSSSLLIIVLAVIFTSLTGTTDPIDLLKDFAHYVAAQEKRNTFIKELKITYEYMYNNVQPNPYMRDRLQSVDKVFIDSGMEYLNKEDGRNIDGTWERLDSYHSVFTDPRLQYATMFLLLGEPGYGKSTLALKYVYDWCNPTFKSPLRDMQILLFLRLRHLKGFTSILTAVKQLLLPRESNLSEHDISDIILSCKSVLVIFDGFDEYSYPDDNSKDDVSAILTRKMFRDTKVIVTTRPSSTPPKLHPNTKQIRLKGFDETAREIYIVKNVANGNTTTAARILEQLDKNHILADICKVPLFFVMFAHITHEYEMSQIFNSVTSFFRYIVSCFYEHMQIRTGADDAMLKHRIRRDHRELYKFAFESLQGKEQTLSWNKEALVKRIGKTLYNDLVEIGILVEENVVKIVDDPGTSAADHIQKRTDVSFYHKLFCEWYAANYVAQYINRTGVSSLNEFFQDMDPVDLQYVYRMACGLNPAAAERIIHYLNTIEGGDKFAILCIFEKTGGTDDVMDTIRGLCEKGFDISGHDSLLMQRSTMQLIQIAGDNNILIKSVVLINCLQSVNLSSAEIMTTSGLALSSRSPFLLLVVSLTNREMSEDEGIAILDFSAMCWILRFLVFSGCVPPREFKNKTTLATLKSENVTVTTMMGLKDASTYTLNLETGRWENRNDGSKATADDFEKMSPCGLTHYNCVTVGGSFEDGEVNCKAVKSQGIEEQVSNAFQLRCIRQLVDFWKKIKEDGFMTATVEEFETMRSLVAKVDTKVIKDNLKWGDGSEVTAEDIDEKLSRYANLAKLEKWLQTEFQLHEMREDQDDTSKDTDGMNEDAV